MSPIGIGAIIRTDTVFFSLFFFISNGLRLEHATHPILGIFFFFFFFFFFFVLFFVFVFLCVFFSVCFSENKIRRQ